MEMKRWPLLLLLAMVSLAPVRGRTKTDYQVRYALRLADVTCDQECGFVQGIKEERFTDLDGVECRRYRYVDDVVNITWYVSDIALNYSFVNKTDSMMVLDTGKIFGHDWDGHPVSFGSTMERLHIYPLLTVPSHTFCSGYLIPMCNYPDDRHRDDDVLPFLPNLFESERAARRIVHKLDDKQYMLRFPIWIDDHWLGYVFTFVFDGIGALVPLTEDRQKTEDREQRTEDGGGEQTAEVPNAFDSQPVVPSLMAQFAGSEAYRVKGWMAQDLAMSFIPEGGRLVAGVTCRVAFSATDKDGAPVRIESMRDDEGNEIRILHSHDGMGCFNINVADGTSPEVYVRCRGKEYVFPLPKAQRRGCAVRVDEASKSGYLNITVTARHTETDSLFTFTLSQGDTRYVSDTLTLATAPEQEGDISLAFERISLSMDSLPKGNSVFTLFNSSGKAVARRLLFIPPTVFRRDES